MLATLRLALLVLGWTALLAGAALAQPASDLIETSRARTAIAAGRLASVR